MGAGTVGQARRTIAWGLGLSALVVVPLRPGPASAQAAPTANAPVLQAQAPRVQAPDAGPRVGYGFDLEAWSVGVAGRLPLLPGLALLPSADYFLSGSSAPWQLNLDIAIRPGWWPVLDGGAGLAVSHGRLAPGATRSGLNVFVGLAPPRLRQVLLRPYVEARWLLSGDRSPFHLVAGCNVKL